MPRYFFNFVHQEQMLIDHDGLDMPEADLEAAVLRVVEAIRSEEPELFAIGPGWRLVVIDEAGFKVARIAL